MRTRIQRYFKTITIVLILVITGLSLLLYHTYNEAISLVKEQFNEQQTLVARQTAIGIEHNMEMLVRELELLSRMPAVRTLNLKEARKTMEQVFEHVKTLYVNDIALVDAKGINRLPLMAPHLKGVDFSYREYFKKASRLKVSTPCYQFITFKGVDIGAKGIIIAMPVFPSDEEFGGVVVFTIKVNELIKGLVPIQLTNSKFWAIDPYGKILYHSEYKPGTIVEKLPNINISLETFLENARAGNPRKANYISPEGISTVASSYPIKIADETWALVIATPEKMVSKLLRSFSRDYTLAASMVLLAILVASLTIFYLINRENLQLQREIIQRKQADEALEKARDELEERVKERTYELTKTTELLGTEIEERKRAEEALRESEDKTRSISTELALGLSEVFKALTEISSGDPSVRIPETSQLELITKLKHMVNLAAENLAEIVDLSHEFAIGLAEHFDVLDRVSKGDLTARVSGASQLELLESLTKVTNQMIESVSREITERKEAEESVHALSRQLMKVQETERQRLSHDLHDHLAQDLSTLKIGLDTLLDNQPEVLPETGQKVSELSKMLQGTIMGVRNLAYNLRPAGLDQLGLVRTVREHCEDYSAENAIKVDFFSAGIDDLKLDFDTKITLYRLIQESLNNVKKHADASHVTVRLVGSFPNIVLRIEDNGKGFDVQERVVAAVNERRMGLGSMEERVALLHGKMRIESRPMKGTKIVIEVPRKEKG